MQAAPPQAVQRGGGGGHLQEEQQVGLPVGRNLQAGFCIGIWEKGTVSVILSMLQVMSLVSPASSGLYIPSKFLELFIINHFWVCIFPMPRGVYF